MCLTAPKSKTKKAFRGGFALDAVSAGFTLIELMVSITLLSLVSYLVYLAFYEVTLSTEVTQIAAAELRLRQFLSHSLSSNLTQAYGDWRPGAAMREPFVDPDELEEMDGREFEKEALDLLEEDMLGIRYYFEGVNGDGAYGPSDSLSFTSAAPLLGNRSLPGFLKQVTYEIVRREPDPSELEFGEAVRDEALYHMLEVTETPIMIAPEDAGDGGFMSGDLSAERLEQMAEDAGQTSPGWSVPIRSVDFEYFDGEEWVEEWDSTSMGRLPWSVRIRASFARPKAVMDAEWDAGLDPLEDPDFDLTITLPAGLGTMQEPPAYVPGDSAEYGDAAGARGPKEGGGSSASATRTDGRKPTVSRRPSLPRGSGPTIGSRRSKPPSSQGGGSKPPSRGSTRGRGGRR